MITDEMLMAYADGELSPSLRAEVELALAGDPALAGRVAAHSALRARMAEAFGAVMGEAPPARLTDLIAAATREDAVVADLAAARAARRGWRSSTWPLGGALAACLAAGLALGVGVGGLWQGSAPDVVVGAAGMVAKGRLATALSDQLSGPMVEGRPVRLGVSFPDQAGQLCRTFTVTSPRAITGVACRESSVWSVKMAMAVAPTAEGGAYRTAGSDLPAPVAAMIDSLGAGPPLDAAAEARARAAAWRP